MNKKEVLKVIDIASFVAAAIATILVLIFEFTGVVTVLKVGIYMYEVCLLALIVFCGVRMFYAYRKKEEVEDILNLSKKQKIFLIVKFILALIAFSLTTVILIKF